MVISDLGEEADVKEFKVTVFFKEPEFFERLGQDPDTIKDIEFTIEAYTTEAAEEKARVRFNVLKRESGVGWQRIIVRMYTEELA